MAGQKTVKAATPARKAAKKAKGFFETMSPSGVADVLGDYLLHDNKGKKRGAKRVKAKK